MLRTRLWMSAVLIAVVVGVLAVDQWLAPVFPFLLLMFGGLSVICTFELLNLLKPPLRPSGGLCGAGIAALVAANWLPHLMGWSAAVWLVIAGAFAGFAIAAFLVEMATFREPGQAVTRMALAVWLLASLGLLASFLAQLRRLPPSALADSTASLARAIS